MNQRTISNKTSRRKTKRSQAAARPLQSPGFSALDTVGWGLRPRLPHSWVIAGVGTTGTHTAEAFKQHTLEHFGCIPQACQFLTVDAAQSAHEENRLDHVSLGVDFFFLPQLRY